MKRELRRRIKSLPRETSQQWPYKEVVELSDVLRAIDQLDEPEVLSQKWINEHVKAVTYDGIPDQTEVIYVGDLKELLVPKQQLPVVPESAVELETLVVPEELGAWLGDKELGEPCYYFTVINELADYWDPLGALLGSFITQNKKELIEVILGSREYKIEEPLYYALAKGHELIKGKGDWVPKYWNVDTTNGNIFIGDRYAVRDKYLIKASKPEWIKFGINDSNADFVKWEEKQK